MRWVGHIARMKRTGMLTGFFEKARRKEAMWEALWTWMSDKRDAVLWTRFIWLRIATSGMLL